MDPQTLIALWGAALSTVLAIYQIIQRHQDRPHLIVSADIIYIPLDEAEADDAKGTPVRTRRGNDDLLEEMLVTLTIANRGRRSIQVSAVVVEHLGQDRLSIHEIVPSPLPTNVEPLTSVEVSIQKEFIDNGRCLTFLGFVDALGRRHAADDASSGRVCEICWNAPSRRAVFQRRDDPTQKVVAFQMKDKATIKQRPLKGTRKKPRVIVEGGHDALMEAANDRVTRGS